MKVYISGKITGLDYEETRAKFQAAAELIEALGMTAVNPFEEAQNWPIPEEYINNPFKGEWEFYIEKCIALLHDCEAIFMLDDWNDSKGARIEKFVAEERGMLILYQKNIIQENEIVRAIGEAVTQVTGIPYITLAGIGKIRLHYFARMIFAKCILDFDGFSVNDVSRILNRNELTIMRYLRNYNNEYRVNRKFRGMANRVSLNIKNIQ